MQFSTEANEENEDREMREGALWQDHRATKWFPLSSPAKSRLKPTLFLVSFVPFCSTAIIPVEGVIEDG
jgi:hypothetical protein